MKKHVGWLWLACWLAGGRAGWLAGWLAGLLACLLACRPGWRLGCASQGWLGLCSAAARALNT